MIESAQVNKSLTTLGTVLNGGSGRVPASRHTPRSGGVEGSHTLARLKAYAAA